MNVAAFMRLFEDGSWQDDYYRVREEVESEWRSGKRHQSWRLVPSSKIVRFYNEYGKYGRINENILLDLIMTVQECAIKIIINSETKDHDLWPYGDEPELFTTPKTKTIPGQEEFPLNDPRNHEPQDLPEKQVEHLRDKAWDRWFLFVSDLSGNPYIRNSGEVRGNARYSDGARSLMKYLESTYSAHTPEEKLMAFDRVINFVHGLGNMAKWFVEGGVETLNKIQAFAPQGITAAGFR